MVPYVVTLSRTKPQPAGQQASSTHASKLRAPHHGPCQHCASCVILAPSRLAWRDQIDATSSISRPVLLGSSCARACVRERESKFVISLTQPSLTQSRGASHSLTKPGRHTCCMLPLISRCLLVSSSKNKFKAKLRHLSPLYCCTLRFPPLRRLVSAGSNTAHRCNIAISPGRLVSAPSRPIPTHRTHISAPTVSPQPC